MASTFPPVLSSAMSGSLPQTLDQASTGDGGLSRRLVEAHQSSATHSLSDNLQATIGSTPRSIKRGANHGDFVGGIVGYLSYNDQNKKNRDFMRLLKKHERALSSINFDDVASMSKKEQLNVYHFFKGAERVFGNQTSLSSNLEKSQRCRVLKWQFRACRSVQSKSLLDLTLAKKRCATAGGGGQSSQGKLGFQIGTGVLGGISLGPSVILSSQLETTQTRIIKDTTTIGSQLTGKLSLANAVSVELGVACEKFSTKKYSNFDAYIKANSGSGWAIWSLPGRGLRSQLKAVLTLKSYQRNIRLANLSQAWLQRASLKDEIPIPLFKSHEPLPKPFQIEYGYKGGVTALAKFDGIGLVRARGELKADVKLTQKTQTMDIIGLYNDHPAIAEERLYGLNLHETDANELIAKMEAHVANYSYFLTADELANKHAGLKRKTERALNEASRRLAVEYVQLKIQHRVDEVSNSDIQRLLNEYPTVFRPDAIKIYTAKADTLTKVVSIEPKITIAGSLDASLKVTFSTVKEDDPHLCGTYLDIVVSGQFKSLETFKNVLSATLSEAGLSSLSSAVIGLVWTGSAYQSHGASVKFSMKIKDHRPVLLTTQYFVAKKDAIDQPSLFSGPVTANFAFTNNKDRLFKEQLGAQSLDLILPVALAKLNNRLNTEWWDGYVAKHEVSFGELIKNIARDNPETLISKELADIKKKTLSGGRVDELILKAKIAEAQPSTNNLLEAKEALKDMLFEYISGYYDAKVKSAWHID